MKRASATFYLVSALVPYTPANIALSFAPKRFFFELSKRHKIRPETLRNAYYRSIENGLLAIDDEGVPRLTKKAQDALAPFQAKSLPNAEVMVVFDIPESQRIKRRILRSTLREFQFTQVQKSVWTSKLDCHEYIADTVEHLGLQKYVILYEAKKINLK